MPPVASTPVGTGQGRELIEQALPYQLGAKTSFVLGSDGVHCTISVPVQKPEQKRRKMNNRTLGDRRILVVGRKLARNRL
jgi:hypothetical protein